MEEIEVLLSTREIMINGKKELVKRFSFMDTIKIASNASTVVSHALTDPTALSNAFAKLTATTEDADVSNGLRLMGIVELLSLIGEDSSDFIRDLILRATNLDTETLNDLDPDVGVELIFMIYEVNKGFFTKCLTKLKEKMPKAETKKETKKKAK